jgi:hypothetical protein
VKLYLKDTGDSQQLDKGISRKELYAGRRWTKLIKTVLTKAVILLKVAIMRERTVRV